MAEWTHSICDDCYDLYREDNGWPESPVRMKWEAFEGGEEVWCCFCGDGIERDIEELGVVYVRYDQAKLTCLH